MPNTRQQLILELVQSQNIETQEQLIDLLRQRGIETSQTTISRDIRKLRLIKERISEDRYRYAMPADQGPVIDNDAHSQRLWRIFRQGVLSIACVQNFVVIKAMPGLGPAAGAAVDDYGFDGFVGSMAGNDTVMMLIETPQQAAAIAAQLQDLLERTAQGRAGR